MPGTGKGQPVPIAESGNDAASVVKMQVSQHHIRYIGITDSQFSQ